MPQQASHRQRWTRSRQLATPWRPAQRRGTARFACTSRNVEQRCRLPVHAAGGPGLGSGWVASAECGGRLGVAGWVAATPLTPRGQAPRGSERDSVVEYSAAALRWTFESLDCSAKAKSAGVLSAPCRCALPPLHCFSSAHLVALTAAVEPGVRCCRSCCTSAHVCGDAVLASPCAGAKRVTAHAREGLTCACPPPPKARLGILQRGTASHGGASAEQLGSLPWPRCSATSGFASAWCAAKVAVVFRTSRGGGG